MIPLLSTQRYIQDLRFKACFLPDQMFHILLQACLTEKQFKFGFNRKNNCFCVVFCCVWLSKASIDVVWLPQASINEFFRPQKCETFGRVHNREDIPTGHFAISEPIDVSELLRVRCQAWEIGKRWVGIVSCYLPSLSLVIMALYCNYPSYGR